MVNLNSALQNWVVIQPPSFIHCKHHTPRAFLVTTVDVEFKISSF